VVLFFLWQLLEEFDLPRVLKEHQPSRPAFLPHQDLTTENTLLIKKYIKPFSQQTFSCGICLSEYLGRDMVRLLDCPHNWCRGCLSELISLHISEGTTRLIVCPDPSCSEPIHSSVVFSLVSQDEAQRYDQLMFVHALNEMSDVAYCPQKNCSMAIILPKNTRYATCPSCSFQFCLKCFGSYHGFGACPLYQSEDERERETQKYISTSTRCCPNCFVAIEKNGWSFSLTRGAKKQETRNKKQETRTKKKKKKGGCSHMFCTKCQTHFDWGNAVIKGANQGVGENPQIMPTAIDLNCPAIREPLNLSLPKKPQMTRTPRARTSLTASASSASSASSESPISKPCPRCHFRRRKYHSRTDHVYCLVCQIGFCFHCGGHLEKNHFNLGFCWKRKGVPA